MSGATQDGRGTNARSNRSIGMLTLSRGRYRARLAETEADIRAAQRLRWRAFRAGDAAREGLDTDAFDADCAHMLVVDSSDGAVVCCFRLMHLPSGAQIGRSYSAQFYELSGLEAYDAPMVEMGRFCIDPDRQDPDILRVAWAAMTGFVDEAGVQMIFGCSSFHGTEAQAYLDAFALLAHRHLAPRRWLPRVKAPAVFRFAKLMRAKPDLKRATAEMPPLLRTYLMMGGWVSDHAVIDRELGTLHVFTALEVAAVPAGRARILRRLSAV
jgi:putative hemolysin